MSSFFKKSSNTLNENGAISNNSVRSEYALFTNLNFIFCLSNGKDLKLYSLLTLKLFLKDL